VEEITIEYQWSRPEYLHVVGKGVAAGQVRGTFLAVIGCIAGDPYESEPATVNRIRRFLASKCARQILVRAIDWSKSVAPRHSSGHFGGIRTITK
jgi:hypothetical protein